MGELSLGRRIQDIVAEYENKLASVENTIAVFKAAGAKLQQDTIMDY